MADNLLSNLDPSTQRSVEKERDGGSNSGGVSMSASLRGSNSSLNSMPGGVLSMCFYLVFVCFCLFQLVFF